MRQQRTIQASLFDVFAGHEIGRQLKAMSLWIDAHPELIGWVAADLRRCDAKDTGRQGLTAETVLRCALLKQHRQLSYEELAFHLEDSASFRAFARLAVSCTPKKSGLHSTISAIRAETWEAINRVVIDSARLEKVEPGDVIRVDSTVTAALIHEPSDSSLLWDAVRVMARLLEAAQALAGDRKIVWRDRRRAAKRRAYAIKYTRGRPGRVAHYRQLIKITRAMLADLEAVQLKLEPATEPMVEVWRAAHAHYRPLIGQVLSQTERRVVGGESVPAGQKIVSLFEPHADIIVKGGRDVEYGHKINLTSGRSGLILDVVIEAGNPADSDRFLPMLERHIAVYGRAPRQAAADGGYASGANLQQAKALGVRDMAFHKKVGLRVEDMVRSRWVYRKLRNFRAGIEAGISCLKIPWAGLDSDRRSGRVRSFNPLTLEPTMLVTATDQPETPIAIHTDLRAIFVSLELSRKTWLITSLSPGAGEKMSKHTVEAGDIAALLQRFAQLKEKARARTGQDFPILTIQEAGLDGFWIHRVLQSEGIESWVVDAASLLVSRRRRRAKTDKIDGEMLVRTLLAYKRGEPRVCSMVKAPTPEEEDRRRICRERKTLTTERVQHVNRIKGLLFAQGIFDFEPLKRNRRARLEELQTGDGRPLPENLKAQIIRELDRLEIILEQVKAVETERDALLEPVADQASTPAAMIAQLKGIGPEFAGVLWSEGLFRHFDNRRQLAAYAGLAPTPWKSGSIDHEQGVSKSGNPRLRTTMVQTTWLWLRHQPDSALSLWFNERVQSNRGRIKKTAIVAMARKLLVALWRYATHGVVIEGAVLRAA